MIIGLGFKARVGKDTVGAHLISKHSFVQESFAYPLKEYIGRQILGFNDKQLYGDWKEVMDPDWGKTPRQMLQLIGTDALREVVHNDIWIIPMKRKLKEHMRNNKSVVITDMRFPNEAKLIKNLGGKLVKIHREDPDKITGEKHSSEVGLEEFNDWDLVLENNGSLEELFAKVDDMMRSPRFVIL